MKHIKLILDFFHRNKIKAFLVLVIITSAMIIFTTSVSQIRYYLTSLSYVDKPEFEDGLYLQISPETDLEDDLYNKDIEDCQKILDTALSSPYVEGVAGFCNTHISSFICYNDIDVMMSLTNEFTAKEFRPNLSDGCWLYECDEGDIPNIVVAGQMFNDVSVGSDIELTGKEFINGRQKFHVIGKVKYPYYSIRFNRGYATSEIDVSSFTDTDGIITLQDVNTYCGSHIYICDNNKNRSLFTDETVFETASCLLAFKDGATEEQREELKEQLRPLSRSHIDDDGTEYTYPAYMELKEILEHTRAEVSDEVSHLLPFNLFVLLIATVSAVIVALLCVRQKQQNDYVAFLCGCSKKKSLLYTFLPTALLVLIPLIIAMLYIAFVPTLAEAGIIFTGEIHFDIFSYLYTALYAVVILAISFFVSSFSIIRKQPIDLYRNKMKG